MQKWEYLFVEFGLPKTFAGYSFGEHNPYAVNGEEIKNWKKGPDMIAFCKELGEQGWELVSLNTDDRKVRVDAAFKRPKP